MSLDHLGYATRDFPTARAFYVKALAPLGIVPMADYDTPAGKLTGFGDTSPFLWIGAGEASGHLHIALTARSRAEVEAFHAAALAAGGTDNGAPGLRPDYHPNYYAAFVLDPDGHNLEAVFHGG
jgi:catechol 2,3-dioxygenase-like lactoylglutathione lyase family enzyme